MSLIATKQRNIELFKEDDFQRNVVGTLSSKNPLAAKILEDHLEAAQVETGGKGPVTSYHIAAMLDSLEQLAARDLVPVREPTESQKRHGQSIKGNPDSNEKLQP